MQQAQNTHHDTAPSSSARTPTASGTKKDGKRAAKRFFSAYAQTWIGLSPIWLMGEAITPGVKVGSQFKRGGMKLVSTADDVRKAITSSSRDILVIVDQDLQEGKEETKKTAEVIKAAGENAILVVTSSLEKMQSILKDTSSGPQIKKAIAENGRDVIVIVDKALKHPLVITGVSKFAKSKGIPHAEALLRLASLGLARLLRSMPDPDPDPVSAEDASIAEEVDASEFEKSSAPDETERAEVVGREGKGQSPPVSNAEDPYAKMKKESQCCLM